MKVNDTTLNLGYASGNGSVQVPDHINLAPGIALMHFWLSSAESNTLTIEHQADQPTAGTRPMRTADSGSKQFIHAPAI